ncbi:L-idonate 5-dehydrogenase [Alginatibacterium sediminis]|uniref:L-idonate 5-dehydrogenase n=1 Tax=Alginatibacterium sediminis TaxID=2164068 RepID=A0A420EGH2_9ALTE|nr:L-idonate 5-dehydrogenase [Alginatibacterium sediminis]RKF19778.1 L-idonate 5-dehydrogenase [Alginatibacterium sediminis]
MDNSKQYRALVLDRAQHTEIQMMTPRTLSEGEVRIKLGAAGICGTDLHYYAAYANSGFEIQSPLTLGHEASGTVSELGPNVVGFEIGDKVAINPVVACGHCLPCRRGQANLCENKRFPGSATTIPHIHGFFREYFEYPASACIKVDPKTSLEELAFVEPLSCSMHAIERAGNLLGRKVLVSGAGPIGVLAAACAKAAGAASVTCTDLSDDTLAIAAQMGADECINVANHPEQLQRYFEGNGQFDVVVEASGALPALDNALSAVRRGGTIVLLSNLPAGKVEIRANMIMLKELNFLGTMQFGLEFEKALSLILNRQVDVRPMLSAQFDLADAQQAFELAKDRQRSMKVQLVSNK